MASSAVSPHYTSDSRDTSPSVPPSHHPSPPALRSPMRHPYIIFLSRGPDLPPAAEAQSAHVSSPNPNPVTTAESALPESEQPVCRVCFNTDPDPEGQSALAALDIHPPPPPTLPASTCQSLEHEHVIDIPSLDLPPTSADIADVITLSIPLPAGLYTLGCACRGELGVVHYACALRWFVAKNSRTCEICHVAAALVQPLHLQAVRNAVEARKRARLGTTGGERPTESESENDSLHASPGRDEDSIPVPAISASERVESASEHLPLPPPHTETDASQGLVAAPLPGGTLPGGIPPGGTAPFEPGGVPGGSLGEVPETVAEGSSEASRHAAAAWFDPDTRFRVTLHPSLPVFNDNEEVFGYNQNAKHFLGTCFLLFVAAVLTLVLSHLFTPLIGVTLSRYGIDFVLGAISAGVLLVLFRMIVVPRILTFFWVA